MTPGPPPPPPYPIFPFPSICPFIFGCPQQSGLVVCSSPAVTARVCSDGRQRRRFVYCFRPCGAPAVTDGLGLSWDVFFLIAFSTFNVFLSVLASAPHFVRSLACSVNLPGDDVGLSKITRGVLLTISGVSRYRRSLTQTVVFLWPLSFALRVSSLSRCLGL